MIFWPLEILQNIFIEWIIANPIKPINVIQNYNNY